MNTRTLTDTERHFLKQYFGASINHWYSVYFNCFVGVAFLTFFAFLIVKAVTKYVLLPLLDVPYSQTYKPYLIILSLVIVVVASHGWMGDVLRFHSKSNQKLRDILNHNQVEIHTLHIQKAAELEEYEDEGSGFFLETDNNTVLFVSGQDLYEYASDAEAEENEPPADKPYGQYFPSTKVTLMRESSQGIRLGLLSDGVPIDNVVRLKGKDFLIKKGKMREYIGPEDGCFYSGSLEEVLERFSIKPLA